MSTQAQLSVFISKAKDLAGKAKEKSVETITDRKVQVTVASAAGGTVAIGACGAALGGVVGIPFALFTFGLSIPFSATVGAVVGGTAGCATGGAAGFAGFSYRTEIAKFLGDARSWMEATTVKTKVQIVAKSKEIYTVVATRLSTGKDFLVNKVHAGSVATKQKSSDLVNASVKLAKDPQAQVTAASAAASGAASGACGAAVGGVVGIPFALFTFGLSIPFAATVGAVVGGTTGAIGGGAVGYGAYGKRAEIRSGVGKCVSYATEKKDQIVAKAKNVANIQSKKAEPPKKIRTASQ